MSSNNRTAEDPGKTEVEEAEEYEVMRRSQMRKTVDGKFLIPNY
jgi:hypothetical protein